MRKRVRPPKFLFVLFDAAMDIASTEYRSEKEAERDAVGPRFRRQGQPCFKVVKYARVSGLKTRGGT